ncbi:MAG: hypothetical protein AAGI03_15065, partial [Pseudomonadota bacterium]
LPLICAGCSVAFYFGVISQPESFYEHRFQTASYVILPLIAPFSLWALFRVFWPVGALLRISPVGFADRRVNPTTIPWSDVSNVAQKGEFVSLTLSRRFLKTYRFSPSQKLLKSFRKSARPSQLLVACWCVADTPSNLGATVEAYHKAYSKTKASAKLATG